MSILKTNVVDLLGLETATGDIVLTLVDEGDWENEQGHLELLQEKLNSYLAFIESGEVFEHLTVEAGRSVTTATAIRVQIIAMYPVPARASEFLAHAKKIFADAGFTLGHEVRGDSENAEFWAPIAWYRDFYDVPRLICAPVVGGNVILDSSFSETIDGHEPTYLVTFVPDNGVSAAPEEIIERAKFLKPIGSLPVATTEFDSTRRRAIKLPARLDGFVLSPLVNLTPPDFAS